MGAEAGKAGTRETSDACRSLLARDAVRGLRCGGPGQAGARRSKPQVTEGCLWGPTGPYGTCPGKATKSLTCHTNECDEKPANGGMLTFSVKFRKTGSLL